MTKRRLFDNEDHVHFVTFSCYKRRRLLDHDRWKRIVLGVLDDQLRKQSGTCAGFVIMPEHVHAVLWFPANDQLSHFMKQWQQRSSVTIKRLIRETLTALAKNVPADDPVWQRRYYDFNIFTEAKLDEKLEYMHMNPVRAGLVEKAIDWPWSSARFYLLGRPVGVPVRYIA